MMDGYLRLSSIDVCAILPRVGRDVFLCIRNKPKQLNKSLHYFGFFPLQISTPRTVILLVNGRVDNNYEKMISYCSKLNELQRIIYSSDTNHRNNTTRRTTNHVVVLLLLFCTIVKIVV